MKIRAIGIIVLLSCTVFMLGINGCDRSKKNSAEARTVKSASSPSAQTPSAKQEAGDDVVGDNIAKDNTSEDKKAPRLSPREYGRENPFEPVVKKSSARRSNTKKTTANKPKQVTIHLSAILGGTAILKVDGADKSVSVGDTVSGMKVSEIRSGEILLDKGGKQHTIALGSQIKL